MGEKKVVADAVVKRRVHTVLQRHALIARHRIRTFLSDLADFKFTAWLTLFAIDICIVIPALFMFIDAPFPLCYVNMATYFGLTQTPLWIGIYRKIKDEQNHARLMREGWETKKDTPELVDEYKRLLHKP